MPRSERRTGIAAKTVSSSKETNMPAFICETRSGLDIATKAALAREITSAVNEIIKSDLDLISVIFHDLAGESTYRAGEPTNETVIFGHIRKGRETATVQKLGLRLSKIWHMVTGLSEDQIEIAINEYPAMYTFRYGQVLPEPPIV